jgi:hypothetical protein
MRHFRSATEFPNPELQTLTPIIRQLGNQNWTTSVEGVTPSYLATADLRIATRGGVSSASGLLTLARQGKVHTAVVIFYSSLP